MSVDGLDDDAIRAILARTRRVAVVGASPRPDRPSNGVFRFLRASGFDVVPVNPAAAGQAIDGIPIVASLAEAGPLDMVDVFRRSDAVATVADEAIAGGARTLWLQLGVVDAASAARAAGLAVVMDRCPKIEWSRLGLGGGWDRAGPGAWLGLGLAWTGAWQGLELG